MTAEQWLGLAAIAVPTLAVVVSMILNARAARENSRAQEGIVHRIDGVDQRSLARDDAHARSLDAHRSALEALARDVSYMAGRQAERDRPSHVPGVAAYDVRSPLPAEARPPYGVEPGDERGEE